MGSGVALLFALSLQPTGDRSKLMRQPLFTPLMPTLSTLNRCGHTCMHPHYWHSSGWTVTQHAIDPRDGITMQAIQAQVLMGYVRFDKGLMIFYYRTVDRTHVSME